MELGAGLVCSFTPSNKLILFGSGAATGSAICYIAS